MSDVVTFVFGAVALGVGMAAGYLRWLRPRQAAYGWRGAGLLALVALAFAGGLLGAPAWWLDADGSFSWDLPPLAARMLAAAGLAFALVCLLVLERPTPRRLRLVVLMLATYLAPLVLAIVLFHLDRFDPAKPITYAFFAVALSMTVASLWYLFRPPALPAEQEDSEPPSAAVRGWLGLVAAVMLLWGLALFVTDEGPARLVWVWPGDLLTSRLIAVMLLTVAVTAWYGWRRADTARLALAVAVVYGVGVALASLWNAVQDKPVRPAYVAVFGAVALVSAGLLLVERLSLRRSRLPDHQHA